MTVRQRKTEGSSASPKDKQSTKTPFSARYSKFGKKHPRTSADGTSLPHDKWAKIVMAGSVAIICIYTVMNHNPERVAIMAKQKEKLSEKRYQNLMCAPSYRKEILDLGNEECLPAKCGRMVSDSVVDERDAHGLLEIAKKGLAKGGSSGGASILDLHSGALSKGSNFVNLYKLHPDLFTKDDFELYRRVKLDVRNAIAEHFGIHAEQLYLSHPTFFSRITPEPAKTLHDEYWHVHIDKETYPNFHYTSLIYLTDFNEDFDGGTFVFVDGNDKINRTIEPRLGRVSAFTSGIENKHHVQPVTKGTRYALTIGFTCDKSKKINDPGFDQ